MPPSKLQKIKVENEDTHAPVFRLPPALGLRQQLLRSETVNAMSMSKYVTDDDTKPVISHPELGRWHSYPPPERQQSHTERILTSYVLQLGRIPSPNEQELPDSSTRRVHMEYIDPLSLLVARVSAVHDPSDSSAYREPAQISFIGRLNIIGFEQDLFKVQVDMARLPRGDITVRVDGHQMAVLAQAEQPWTSGAGGSATVGPKDSTSAMNLIGVFNMPIFMDHLKLCYAYDPATELLHVEGPCKRAPGAGPGACVPNNYMRDGRQFTRPVGGTQAVSDSKWQLFTSLRRT